MWNMIHTTPNTNWVLKIMYQDKIAKRGPLKCLFIRHINRLIRSVASDFPAQWAHVGMGPTSMSVRQWQIVVDIEEMGKEEKRQWLQRYAMEVLHKTPYFFLESFAIDKLYTTLYVQHECCYGYTRNPSSRQPGCTKMIMKSLDETLVDLEVSLYQFVEKFWFENMIFFKSIHNINEHCKI